LKTLVVRQMTLSDIPEVIEMSRAERWILIPEDLRVAMGWTPTCCMAAEMDGKMVGFVTAFLSDGVGWWGNLLVRPEARGKGMGGALIRRVTGALDRCNARTVIVVAARGKESLYRRFGYTPYQNIVTWVGYSSANSKLEIRNSRTLSENRGSGQGKAAEDPISQAMALDEDSWCFSRGPLLHHLARRREILSVSSPFAFLMHEQLNRYHFIGPWEAREGDKRAAGNLLGLLFDTLGTGASVFLKSPEGNALARQILKEYGFFPVEKETIMFCGRQPEPDMRQIFAIATGGASG